MHDPSPGDTRETPPEVPSELPAARLEVDSKPDVDSELQDHAEPQDHAELLVEPVPEVDSELHSVAHIVHEEFDGQVDPRAVDEALSQVTARFDGAPVRVFVPLLVRRYAREELMTRLRETG